MTMIIVQESICRVSAFAALALCFLVSAPSQALQSDGDRFKSVDSIVEKAVSEGNIPGAVLIIGHDGKVVHRKAFGSRSLEPVREPMTIDTVFDLASLTKCIATATSVMKLVEEGRIRLGDSISTYLPDFAQNGKKDITIRDLLTHYSGLPPDLDLKSQWEGREAAYQMAMHEKPINPPGSQFVYSDINFETLGFLVEKVTGQPLNEYAAANIFAPLGMKNTRFLPPKEWLARIAPTQYDEQGQMLRGIVHDPTARRMGGVAGHAGLFSTGDDMALFAEDFLSGFTVLSRSAIAKMTSPQQPPNATVLRGLGWDIDSPFSTNRGELLPVGSFGHTGFTGTSLWIDPVTDTYIILLTNAVHPHGGKSTVSLRCKVATAVVQALNLTVTEQNKLRLAEITGYNEIMPASRRIVTRNGDVKAGIDVLEAHNFRELHADTNHPVRVGLVTNQTGIDAHGERTADILAHAPGVKLAAIFSPEHGIAGTLDTTVIGNSTDEATGATIYSAYGDTDAKRRPSITALESLDEIVFDIQDIGVRFYTYESTLGYFLEAAAETGKEIVVLDRPNPIGGTSVQGPVADEGRESFVGYWQIPVRHGMTMGELAKMFDGERNLHAKLRVVSMQGWIRGDWFDSTGELWVNPSPNMRSLTAATLYPGIGMIETSNISVGRGTDKPFELVGAPWVKSKDLASYLNSRTIAGVRFIPTEFTPDGSVFAHEKCGGVQIIVTDRNSLDSPELGIEVASALQSLYPGDYKVVGVDTLMLSKASLDAIVAGQDPRRIAEQWRESLERFEALRAKYLIY
jgi:uncharacterized protein YbbC (DUF1343 family)